MNYGDLHWITYFIWGIADDCLRDLYVRGRYREVILPMVKQFSDNPSFERWLSNLIFSETYDRPGCGEGGAGEK